MGKGDLGKTDLVTREHTIHLAKLLHQVTFKKKTPRAIRAIKNFVARLDAEARLPADSGSALGRLWAN